jgi:hypothetical protein
VIVASKPQPFVATFSPRDIHLVVTAEFINSPPEYRRRSKVLVDEVKNQKL